MSSRTSFHFHPIVGLTLLAVLLGACVSEPPKPVTIEATEEISATVEAVNIDTRMVTLLAPDGQKFTMQAGPEVRNLPQVKVGDRVITRYYTAMAAELRRRGDGSGETEAPVIDTAFGRAAEGARPSGAAGRQVRQTVRITTVDKKNHVVGFYGSDGLARLLPVRTPQAQEFISKLKAGDEVEVTYTEAVAMSVEPSR
jgi:hypothetical protein